MTLLRLGQWLTPGNAPNEKLVFLGNIILEAGHMANIVEGAQSCNNYLPRGQEHISNPIGAGQGPGVATAGLNWATSLEIGLKGTTQWTFRSGQTLFVKLLHIRKLDASLQKQFSATL